MAPSPAAGLVLLLCAAGISPLAAQGSERQTLYEGFYFGFGVGAGNAWVDCSRCGEPGSAWDGGFAPITLAIDVGWSVRPDLLLGAELDMWGENEYSTFPDTRGLDLTYLGPVIQYYPLAPTRLFAKAGFGLGRLRMHDGRDEILDSGGAALAGVGYDVRVKRTMTVTPYVHMLQWRINGATGQIGNVAMQSPRNPRVLHAGVAFRYY